MEDILKEIEEQSDFDFFFNNKHVDLNRRVSISVDRSNIFSVLKEVFAGTNVRYSVLDKKIILSVEVQSPQQEKKMIVSGIISDVQGEAVIGASIVEVGTTNGTVSDVDGNFTLSVSENASIQVSFIGFSSQTLSVKGKTNFKIVLKEDSELLQEVVVTGYGGKVSRSKLTNSISTVNPQMLDKGIYTNPSQALSGSVPGLKVSLTSGNPTSSPKIILRGGTNFDGSGGPLVVVDGQLRDNFDDINPQDIASMDVLKDAGATAIYGARASNGVSLIGR